MAYKLVDGALVKEDDSNMLTLSSPKVKIFRALVDQISRAEAAEDRAVSAEELAERRLNEIINSGKAYAAKSYVVTELQRINGELLAERDEARSSRDAVIEQCETVTDERDEARRQLEQAQKALEEVKRALAVGRNVGEDKEQAYQDAEEVVDFALNGKQVLQQFEHVAPLDWREADWQAETPLGQWLDGQGDEVEP